VSAVARRVVLATNNAHKLAELRRIVTEAAPDIEVLGLADLPRYPEPAETGRTFADNALLKARACLAATGLPALADDSGLEVDVLNGMPGVRSARWAGPQASDADNNSLLLRQLYDVPPDQRSARFVCAMAAVLPNGAEHVRLGIMSGRLTEAPVGDNGFGYDPLFVADGQTVTNAELSPAAKDAISHRGQAIRAMAPVLVAELSAPAPAGKEG
jgi:XTP/dITP diphosphohydrolase